MENFGTKAKFSGTVEQSGFFDYFTSYKVGDISFLNSSCDDF
jgi:hypothetical protein